MTEASPRLRTERDLRAPFGVPEELCWRSPVTSVPGGAGSVLVRSRTTYPPFWRRYTAGPNRKRKATGRSDMATAVDTAVKMETVFTMDTSSIKYGPGATREVGSDMAALGAKRVMVVTDPRLSDSEPVAIALAALKADGAEAVLYDSVVVEPTDASFLEAAAFATEGTFDGFLPVGGGSAI